MPRRASLPTTRITQPAQLLQPHRLIISRRVIPPRHPSPPLSDNNTSHIRHPHDRRDHAVCDFSRVAVLREIETEPAVDDAKGYDDPAEPEMGVRPEGPPLEVLEVVVVEQAEDGLEEQEDEEEDADNWVRVVELDARVSSRVTFFECFSTRGGEEIHTILSCVAMYTPSPNAAM